MSKTPDQITGNRGLALRAFLAHIDQSPERRVQAQADATGLSYDKVLGAYDAWLTKRGGAAEMGLAPEVRARIAAAPIHPTQSRQPRAATVGLDAFRAERRVIDRIPDASRLYHPKDGRLVPPANVDHAHERLIAQNFVLAAKTELRNDGVLWVTFVSNIANMEHVVYAWVLADTIVRIGKSEGVFCTRFGADKNGGQERFVTRALQLWPEGRYPDEAQLWVTLFRRAGWHGRLYAKRAEFVPSLTGRRLVCPEELDLLRRHHPALNQSDR